MNIPVYVIAGFLDAGKTQFINGTLADGFARKDRTLLIRCEEGEEEYDPALLRNVTVVDVEDEEDLTREFLQECEKKYRPRQVMVEYNGMWQLETLWNEALPPNWFIVQTFTFVEASTFELYARNMAQQTMDKVKNADVLVFNRCDDTLYVLGSVMGPHPFPTIVRDFQKIIGKEIKEQMLEAEGRLPDAVIACVGGGSNAMGAFYEFIPDKEVALIGCEAAGLGIDNPKNAATIANGTTGIFHGMKSLFCQDEYGQIAPVYSISAGLDYPGIGPEHAMLHDTGRAQYVPVTDEEAVEAFEYLSRTEGIIPAIESSHAVAYAMKYAKTLEKDKIIVINISGRGDKDVAAIARYRGVNIYE